MAKVITFPESEPLYVFDRDCLAFHAIVDSKSVKCMVTAELLMANFHARGCSEAEMRNAYREYKTEIQEIARRHIENGWIDDEGRVFLTTRHTRLNVTFGESLTDRALVASAHRILLDLIGPNAETVNVEWQGDEDPQGHHRMSVRIDDRSTIDDRGIPYTENASFGPKELADPNRLSVSLGLLWSSILRVRSRKLDLTLG